MRLLATTDFSEPAGFALDRAVALASSHPEAELSIIHVHSPAGLEVVRQMFGREAEEMESNLLASAEDQLRSLSAGFEQTLGRPVGLLLRTGQPAVEIANAASEVSTDLVVMGARGKSPAQVFFLGSTVERVIRKTESSVLAVKGAVASGYRRVLVAVDFSTSSRPAIELAWKLNPGADVVLLHVFEAPFEERFRRAGAVGNWIDTYREQTRRVAEQKMERLGMEVEAAGIRARRLVVRDSPAHSILDHARELAADLVVVGKYGESAVGDLLLGSVARRVVLESKIDVLVASRFPGDA